MAQPQYSLRLTRLSGGFWCSLNSSTLKWLPPVGLTMHGYSEGVGTIQAMTKPHNPGYEYDIIVNWNQRRVDANEADLAAIGMKT